MKENTIAVPPAILTPEYLYKKGIAFYGDALTEEINLKQQENFLNSILYLQGAMLLGSIDACQQLSKFYDKENNIGISQPDQRLNNLIEAMQQQYQEISIHNINRSLLDGRSINLQTIKTLKTKFLNEQPEYLVLANLRSFIKEVNKKLSKNYCLITNENDFKNQKEITDFILPKKPEKVDIYGIYIEKEIREDIDINDNGSNKDYVLTGAELCTIS